MKLRFNQKPNKPSGRCCRAGAAEPGSTVLRPRQERPLSLQPAGLGTEDSTALFSAALNPNFYHYVPVMLEQAGVPRCRGFTGAATAVTQLRGVPGGAAARQSGASRGPFRVSLMRPTEVP